jgi:hypothetical protein
MRHVSTSRDARRSRPYRVTGTLVNPKDSSKVALELIVDAPSREFAIGLANAHALRHELLLFDARAWTDDAATLLPLPHNVRPRNPAEASRRGLAVHLRHIEGPAACGAFPRWEAQLTRETHLVTCGNCLALLGDSAVASLRRALGQQP